LPLFVSVVVPVYGAPEALPELHQRLAAVFAAMAVEYEIILVSDSCPRGSWQAITALSQADGRVVGVNLSRNFGQHVAITAGVDRTRGDFVIVMDCDLQDCPEDIPAMFAKIQERPNVDIVFGRRGREDPFFKRLSSRLFYRVLEYMTDRTYDPSIANFGVYRRSVIDAYCSMRERLRFFPLMLMWLGFNVDYCEIRHPRRPMGKSSYSFSKLVRLALDVMVAFSDKPLRLAVKLGFGMSLISFLAAIYFVLKALFTSIPIQGWASLIVSVWFLSGLLLLFMGVTGVYIGRIFDQVKLRPLYVVREVSKKTGT